MLIARKTIGIQDEWNIPLLSTIIPNLTEFKREIRQIKNHVGLFIAEDESILDKLDVDKETFENMIEDTTERGRSSTLHK